MRFPYTGLLPVEKPAGISSRGVVDAVAKAPGMKAVGHAGTLDPIASGVVVVCVGHATRLVDFLHALPKRYQGEFLLGRSSPSDDTELPVELEADPPQPSAEAVQHALAAFRGSIMQRPCDYSAVHIDGKRAYALARKGRAVELTAKPVTIHSLQVLAYDWPTLMLDVECSSGTYIRALGRDLATSLNTKAVMSGLVRTEVGPFRLADAVPLQRFRAASPEEAKQAALHWLRPAIDAVRHLPTATLSSELIERIACGGIVPTDVVPRPKDTAVGNTAASGDVVAATDREGSLVGILRPHPAGWRVRPNFVGRA